MRACVRVPIDISLEAHINLKKLKLRRSAELGRLVSMGYIVEELINREMGLTSKQEADLFASRD